MMPIFCQSFDTKLSTLVGLFIAGKDGSKLAKMKIKEFQKIVEYYQKEIVTKKYASAPELLKSYSPWLAAFQASNFSEVW